VGGAGFFPCAILGFAAGTALFLGGLAGAVVVFRAGDFDLAAAAFLTGEVTLRRDAGAVLFAFGFAGLLLEAGLLDLVALRAGAFSVAERFNIGLGRAEDLPANDRFFDEEPVEV
jgi:hypothetical protein